jgi:hypothetical protein
VRQLSVTPDLIHFPWLLQFTKISGGISNILVKATPSAESDLEPVAAKVFGEKTELLIDRDAERQVVVDLSRQGFGPKVSEYLCIPGMSRCLQATKLISSYTRSGDIGSPWVQTASKRQIPISVAGSLFVAVSALLLLDG